MEKVNYVRTYSNTVHIRFAERGENFTLKVPHYAEWIGLIKFLKKRGFEISENEAYKKHYASLSKYHKIGNKKNVWLLMEIGADFISVEFGNARNLWTGISQSFWSSKSDSRYSQTTYLEDKAVELEIKKVIDRFLSKGFCYKQNDKDRTDIENIIHSNNQNPHIHGKITCLEDIGKSITETSYNYNHNSWDANKKRIICGDKKCFYDYNNRLVIGTVYHNINNMWWVIVNGKSYNEASFDLFDYDASLPNKKPADKNKIKILIRKYESEHNYERCKAIRDYAIKMNILNY